MREMRGAFFTAGFEVYDFAMTDLLTDVPKSDEVQMKRLRAGSQYGMCSTAPKAGRQRIRNNEAGGSVPPF